ncbi:hypothetical protein MCUN1_002825 [Malassezia cuniculi]|uniref:Uncharacterized protein n=1 Tax=Malassezia cuniculi TaxID=948313 RepID=A0AAF0J7Q9_9BASI|nr:hypothetical protein MCUN1_002825 [Malassezia cuniculi]
MAKKKAAPQLDACREFEDEKVLQNALPGRDSFDIEIYGMTGVPDRDLIQWRARQAAAAGVKPGSASVQAPAPKRPKIQNVVLTPEQLRAQLEAHKSLMNAAANPPTARAQTLTPEPLSTVAVAAQPQPDPAPDPAPVPAPAPAGPQPHPHRAALERGEKQRLVYTDTLLSPDEKLARLARYAYVESAPVSVRAPAVRTMRPTAAELF